jgi:hypothetical protein
VQQKEREITTLKNNMETTNKSQALKIAGLEDALATAQRKLLQFEKDKEEHEEEVARIRDDHERAVSNLRSISTDKEEVSLEVRRMKRTSKEY